METRPTQKSPPLRFTQKEKDFKKLYPVNLILSCDNFTSHFKKKSIIFRFFIKMNFVQIKYFIAVWLRQAEYQV